MPATGVPAPRADQHAVTDRAGGCLLFSSRLRRVWPLLYLLAFAVVGLSGLALGSLVEAGRAVDQNDLDHRVWRGVVQVRETYPGVSSFLLVVTKLGDQPWASIAVFASVLGLFALERRGGYPLGRWGPWLFLWVVLAGQLLTWLLKAHFQRSRPEVLFRLIVEDSYSFPSGHALTSACFCGFWTWIVWRLLPGRRFVALMISFPILLIAALIAVSRVWLGVHYLNDVLGGVILGFLWTGLSVILHEWVQAALQGSKKSP